VRLLKGPRRPIFSQDERAEMLSALACVDFVALFDDNTAEQLVSLLQPDIYVKGADYAPELDKELPEATIARAYVQAESSSEAHARAQSACGSQESHPYLERVDLVT
jgi:D-beta-D-heptose 7-phosphate kinase / D-beta-D-heptose 1-phosphate adenosyltransferase